MMTRAVTVAADEPTRQYYVRGQSVDLAAADRQRGFLGLE